MTQIGLFLFVLYQCIGQGGQGKYSGKCIDIERKNRLLKVCYVLATSATFLALFSCCGHEQY
jgi:hypothetical protein